MAKILINKVQCIHCDDIIESTHRHDFKMCKCGKIGVDGGKEYLRRIGKPEDAKELSKTDKSINDSEET